jgi:branched-subunit amino acid ABC-type transport system permease component
MDGRSAVWVRSPAGKPQAMSVLADAVGFGIVSGAIISLSTMAMSLQHSVTKHANFSHGELLTVAAYAMFAMQHLTDNVLLDGLVGLVVAALLALVLDEFVFKPFRTRTRRLVTLLVVTAAASQVLQGTFALIWGANYVTLQVPTTHAKQVGPFLWTTTDEVVIGLAVVAFLVTHVVLRYTSFGRSQRAVADDADLARVCGVNTSNVIRWTWIAVGLLAGLGGATLAVYSGTFDNLLGFNFLLVTFAAMIVGGIGKMYGAVIAGLLIGIVTSVAGAYTNQGYNQLFALGLLAIVVLVRPSGLFNTRAADTRAFG